MKKDCNNEAGPYSPRLILVCEKHIIEMEVAIRICEQCRATETFELVVNDQGWADLEDQLRVSGVPLPIREKSHLVWVKWEDTKLFHIMKSKTAGNN